MKKILPVLFLISCASAPKQEVRSSAPDKCFMIMESFCSAFVRCNPGKMKQAECETSLGEGCRDVTSVSDDDAFRCIEALDHVPCDGDFPQACLGIVKARGVEQ